MRYSRAVTELLGGRYALEREVAEGAIATVWRGEARGEGGFTRPVALRVLREPWERARLTAWAAHASELAAIASPWVEQVFDGIVVDGRAVIASEWIDGISVRQVLSAHAQDERPLAWPLAASIMLDVLRGLSEAHEASPALCHECVDPRSVRLSRAGVAKLTRFGVTSALAAHGVDRRALEARGLRHPAPELVAGGRATPASDRFGAGALFFELLAGVPAFPAPGAARDVAVRAGELADLTKLRPDVPELLVALIERAMRDEPSERFDSAAAMARAIVQVLGAEAQPHGPDLIAREVAALRARVAPKPAPSRPMGLAEQRTMHVDLAELTVLPSAPDGPPEEDASGADRRPRYRFGYKDRRANLAARATPLPAPIAPQESEAAPLPLTRRSETEKRPRGLAAQRTEFLDAEQVDRLTLPDKKK